MKIRRSQTPICLNSKYVTTLKLTPPLPEQVKALFKPLEHNLASVSIMRGLTASDVYVDSVDATWAVTYSNSRILVSGDIDCPELVKAVQDVVDTGVKTGRKGFVIYYPVGSEKGGIGEHIRGINPYPNLRNYYVLEAGKTGYPVNLPQGYSIQRISYDFLEKGFKNTELVMEEMRSERASVDDFIDKSFGFCGIQGDVIASWCMSEYNTGNRFEIGIETHTEHRRKGLAFQTARACINHGVETGYDSVGWHCWKKNEASNRSALSLGFKHILEYPVEYLEVK